MDDEFRLAIMNIARFGDTDIFPFPIENAMFYDEPEKVLELLTAVHNNFETAIETHPPVHLSSLAPAGYSGFRWATQFDPLWNAYLLALVLSYAPRLESARIPTSEQTVFSYRIDADLKSGSLFNPTVGWPQFKSASLELANTHSYVLVCDIADFYARVYHHRVDNALRHIDDGSTLFKRIMLLLQQYAQNVSYGLPVGGPAARMLAELLLNRTDRLFRSSGLIFTRFVDDYHFFADSIEQAHAVLVRVAETLYANEGLSLQKGKTRIMSAAEFKASAALMKDDVEEPRKASLLGLSLKFDPYSANPKGDYQALSEAVRSFDILSLLAAELTKTRVHGPLTKKLISSIRFLESKVRDDAILSLIGNVEVLSPLFGLLAITIKDVHSQLSEKVSIAVHETMCNLIGRKSHIVQVDLHMAYAIRVLSLRKSEEAEGLLARLYESSRSMLVRKEIILAMTKLNAVHWLADKRRFFQTMTPWEKRAFVVASYCLVDEGRHWREHTKDSFDNFTAAVHEWAGKRAEQIRSGILPL